MPSKSGVPSKGELRTLVILLAATGTEEYDQAYDVFDDLFAKVSPDSVIVGQMKPESGPPSKPEVPDGLLRLKDKHGVSSMRGCFIKSNSVDDGSSNDWEDYVPVVLKSLELEKTDTINLNFHVSSGGFTVSSAFYSICQIIGCSAWVTVKNNADDSWSAIEVSEIPLSPAQESTFASCAEKSIESGEPQPFTSSEVQSIDGAPKAKGVYLSMQEMISRGLIQIPEVEGVDEEGEMKMFKEKSHHGEGRYIPSKEALFEGIISLSKKTSQPLPRAPQTGIIITARASDSKEKFRSFLQEHGFHHQFTKVALIVVDFGKEHDLGAKSEDFAEEIRDLKGTELVGGVRSCNGIIPSSEDPSLSGCSFRLMSQFHKIIRSEEGVMIDWSILSSGVPAVLRTHFLRYSHASGITVIDPIRGSSEASGTRGSEITYSGQDFTVHRVAAPSGSDIDMIREIWSSTNKHVKEALATCLVADEPIPYKGLRERNRVFFNQGQWQFDDSRMKDSKVNQKARERLKKLGAITESDDPLELTSAGVAAAKMIWIREEEW